MPLGAGDGATNSGAVRPGAGGGTRRSPTPDNKPGVTSGLQSWAQETAAAVNSLSQQAYHDSHTGAIQEIMSMLSQLGTQRDSTGFNVNLVPTAEGAADQAAQVASTTVNPWEAFGAKDPALLERIATGSTGPDQALIDSIATGSTGPDQAMIDSIIKPPERVMLRADAEAEAANAAAKVEAARDAQRRRAIGSDVAGPYKPGTPAPGAEGNKVREMTMRRYEALSPKERAAVDFNTLLVQAVEADAENQKDYAPTPQQQATYDALVAKTFGEDDGTDYYAPEVMGLLQQIGYQDDAAKLQDFLGLNAAITKGDLRHLPDETPFMGTESDMVNPVQRDEYELTNTLADATLKMERQMAKTNALLASIPESARLANVQYIADQLGALPSQPDQIYGYGQDETSQLFQKGYGILATKSNQADKDLILTQMNDRLTPAEFKEFLQYVDMRSANAQQYGLLLADVPEGGDPKALWSPEKFRSFMGLDEGFSDGT